MKLDLKAIEQRCEKATPGPWRSDDRNVMYGESWENLILAISSTDDLDANFIAHARQDIPALLAFARDAKAALEAITNPNLTHCIEPTFTASQCLAKYFQENGE